MTILASAVIDKAAVLLFDVPNIKWPRTELLSYINMGQRLIVTLQPSAVNTIEVIKMAAGSRQHVPTSGWLLLDILRNMGTDGATPGRAVRLVSRRILDSFDPSWHYATERTSVDNYVFDPQDQTAFFVYPPSNGLGYLELNYAATPANIAVEGNPITVPDVYEAALLNYVLYRAATKAVDFAPGGSADSYLTAFSQMLNAKVTAEQANNPNLALGPMSVQVPGGTS